MMHSYRLQLMNPGAEPDDPASADWCLWFAQIRLLGSLQRDAQGAIDPPEHRQIAYALEWLGEIRVQRCGIPDDEPGAWPNDSLLGVIDALFTFNPADLNTFEPFDVSDPTSLAWALRRAHREVMCSLAEYRIPPAENIVRAVALLRFLATYRFPKDHEWAEADTLCHSMEIWIRG